MRKKLFFVLIIAFMALFLTRAYADVLFGKEYYDSLRKHIAQAKKTIAVMTDVIIMESKSPVNALVDDLIAAKKRGVDVKVVLEDEKLGESLSAYNKLKENGLTVRTDLPGSPMRVRGVVIDGRYAFLGSADWSGYALENKDEATLLVDSPSDAEELMRFIEEAAFKGDLTVEHKGVGIPDDFILAPSKGRVLLKNRARRQLDLYLLLRKVYARTGEPGFKIDEKSLLEEMGYAVSKRWGSRKSEEAFYRDTVEDFLKRLEQAGLVRYKKGNLELVIDKKEESEALLIVLPYEYWKYGYERMLSLRAKYMYLIALYEASRSAQYPYWFHNIEDMSKLYGIDRDTIYGGLGELEDAGVIEIIRDKPTFFGFSSGKAKVYKLLPLVPLID